MAGTKPNTPPNMPPNALAGMEQLASHMPEMMLALTRMQSTAFDAVMRQNIEMLDFLKARFERDRRLAGEIAKAEDATEAMALWQSFWQKAVEDYGGERGRLATKMQKAAGDAVEQARTDAEQLVHRATATAV